MDLTVGAAWGTGEGLQEKGKIGDKILERGGAREGHNQFFCRVILEYSDLG